MQKPDFIDLFIYYLNIVKLFHYNWFAILIKSVAKSHIYISWICNYYTYNKLDYVIENLFEPCVLQIYCLTKAKLQILVCL